MIIGDMEWLKRERSWLMKDAEHHTQMIKDFTELYEKTGNQAYSEVALEEQVKLNRVRNELRKLRRDSGQYTEEKKEGLVRP